MRTVALGQNGNTRRLSADRAHHQRPQTSGVAERKVRSPPSPASEIAERTGKSHADLLRSTQTTLGQAEIGESRFAGTYPDAQNRTQPCYRLPRFECDLVVSGYSVKYRAAIIRRWHELNQVGTLRPRDRLSGENQPDKDPKFLALYDQLNAGHLNSGSLTDEEW